MSAKKFFSKEDKARIVAAIQEAEKQTSGEIRLHVESRCTEEALTRAKRVFIQLKMEQTKLRNGTLIYLALEDRKFAIFGDEGINKVVPDHFWKDVKDEMRQEFVKGAFVEGIVIGVKRIGEKLKAFFPYQSDDVNELPDDISIGK